jgi:outer membrane immunogenic protein
MRQALTIALSFVSALFLAAVLGGGFSTATSAADSSAPVPVYGKVPVTASAYDWTGFYIGVNVGGSLTRASTTSSTDCPATGGYFCSGGLGLTNQAAISADGSGVFNGGAPTGGGQVGFNWQYGGFVVGPELDFESFQAKTSSNVSRQYPPPNAVVGLGYNIQTSTSTDWLFTSRLRAGWAINNVLLYATGGLALTDLTVSNSYTDNDLANTPGPVEATGNSKSSQLQPGWTVGGGLEAALYRNWTVKVEYLFVDLGSLSTTNTVTNPTSPGENHITTSSDLTSQIIRAGMNYRF